MKVISIYIFQGQSKPRHFVVIYSPADDKLYPGECFKTRIPFVVLHCTPQESDAHTADQRLVSAADS